MEIGQIVNWVSQSQGSEKKKEGKIIAFIPAHEDGYKFLPANVKKSHYAKMSRKITKDRVLVEVMEGKNLDIPHYYAPLQRELERQGN